MLASLPPCELNYGLPCLLNGIKVKREKSKYLLLRGTTELTNGDQAVLTALQSRGITEADLIEIRGIPFSTDQARIADFVKTKFTNVCTRIGDVTSALKSYSPLGALEIIKLCILPSVVHLMRSLPTSITLEPSLAIGEACFQANSKHATGLTPRCCPRHQQ